jgi:biotin carboxyl carrier protein
VASAGHTGKDLIKAPMPGTILSIAVTPGETVQKGQVLLILEAMKMENEIVAPRAGTVAGIHISKGSSVKAGELLVSLD